MLVLGVCCTWWQLKIMTCRDREGWLNFVFCNDGRVMDEKERDGGWRWERCGGYEWIWEISVTTCLIELWRPPIGVITRQIGTRTCHIRDGQLTRTQNSLQSQFLMMISPISSHLFSSRPQLYHHLRTQSYVIPLYFSMLWSRVNDKYSIHWTQHTPSTAFTKYSIHRVLHTPSTAFTEYSIHWVLRTPHTASSQHRLSLAPSQSLRRPSCTQFSTFPQLQVNRWIESELLSRLPPKLRPPDWPSPSTPPISLDHGLQVHLQPRSITISECISKFTPWRPASESPNTLDYSLQVPPITASKWISKLARSQPRSQSERNDTGCTEIQR